MRSSRKRLTIFLLTNFFIVTLCGHNLLAEIEKYHQLQKQFSADSFIYVADWQEEQGRPNGIVTGYYNQGQFKGTKAVEMQFLNGLLNGVTRFYPEKSVPVLRVPGMRMKVR